MNMRAVLLAVLALVTATITALLVRAWVNSERAAMAPEPAPVRTDSIEILVADRDLPAGTLLKPAHMRWQPWPEDGVDGAYYLRGESEGNDIVGAVVRHGIPQAQPLARGALVKPGEQGFLAAVLRSGMRAVSVPVSATSGIAGFVFPGDRVDLILTHTLAEESEAQRSRSRASETVLSDVRVLAVDQKTNDQTEAPLLAKTTTLEVTPKQAEMIAVVREMGTLSLSLRSLTLGEDGDPTETVEAVRDRKPVRVWSHTWDSEASALLPRRPEQMSGNVLEITVLRGGDVQKLQFRAGAQ